MALKRVEEYLEKNRNDYKSSEQVTSEYQDYLNSRRDNTKGTAQNTAYWTDDNNYDNVMNDNVKYLLNKRYKTYHFGTKKKAKDNTEYSFYGDDLKSKSRTDLSNLAKEYASRRTTGRTTSEADAWRADREKANAGLQADLDSGKSTLKNLSNYTTGNSGNYGTPYASIMQDMESLNKTQVANDYAKQKQEESKKKILTPFKNLNMTLGGGEDNTENIRKFKELPDYQEMVSKGKKESVLFNDKQENGQVDNNEKENAADWLKWTLNDFAKSFTPKVISEQMHNVADLYKGALDPNILKSRSANIAYMDDTEKDAYNYIVGKYGKDMGTEYIKSLEDDLNERSIKSAQPQIKEYSQKHPVQGAFANIGTSLMTPAGYLKALNDKANGSEINPYDMAFSPAYMENATREGIKENTGAVGDFLVDTGLSMGQTAIRLPMGNAGLAYAAGGAGTGTLLDSIQRGGSDDKALLNATFAGAAEAFFEKFSLEGLNKLKATPVNSVRDFLKNLGKQAVTEGSEEMFTEIANTVSDNAIMRELSNYNLGIQSYKAKGMNDDEAKKSAFGDILKNVTMAGLGGAVSGGLMGTGYMGINAASNYADTINTGRGINQDYREYAQGIDTDRNNYNSNSDYQNAVDLQSMAQEFATRQQDKGFISNYEKGKFDRNINSFVNNLGQQNGEAASALQTDIEMLRDIQDPVAPASNAFTEGKLDQVIPSSNETFNQMPQSNNELQQRQEPIPIKNTIKAEELSPWSEVYGKNGKEAFKSVYEDGTDVETYYRAFSRYYNAGRYNMDIQSADKSALAAMITPDQAAEAYKAGAKDRNMEIGYDPKTGKMLNMIETEQKTGGIQEVAESATKEQKQVAESFGKRTGLKFELIDDIENGAVASYEPGKIKISVNSKNFNASISHELTHFIQDYSPDLYQMYQDTAVKALTEANSVSFDDLIESYSRNYEKSGQKLTRAQIIDEISADATEKFLNDPEYVDKIVKENRTLGEKILDFINDMIDSLKSLMKTGSTRKAAKGLEENISHYEVARNVWMAGLEEAGDRYKTGYEKTSTDIQEDNGSSKNNKTDNSIRYQLEEVDDYSDRFLQLIHENDDLREANTLLQKQFELTSKDEMRQEDIRKVAREVLKKYNSTYDSKILERNVTKLFEYIRSSDQVDGKEVSGVATDIARSILKNSRQVETELTEQYKGLREQIRNTKIKLTEQDKFDLMAAGGYNEFRKQYFGRMKLGNDGISVDSFYDELAGQHPELFDIGITHPSDRLMQIGNVLDMTQEQVMNPYHANMDEMSYIVGQELLDSYFNVRNGKPTYADKKALEIDRVKRDYKKKMEKFKQSRIIQYEAIISEKNRNIRGIKDDHSRELIAQQEKFNKKLQERRDSLRRSNAKKIILKETKAMQTWLLNPTDKKHIPQELKGKVAEFLESINFSSKDDSGDIQTQRTKAWNEAQKLFQGIMEREGMVDTDGKAYYIDIDPDMVERINGLVGKVDGISKLEELDAYNMEELQKTVQSMKKAITEINVVKSNVKYREVSLLAEDVFRQTENIKKETEYAGSMGAVDKFMNYDMIDPLTMFEKVGPAFKTVYDSIREGLNQKTLKLKQSEDYIREVMKQTNITEKDIRDWSGKNAKTTEFTVNGGKLKLTISQIMSLYELDKRNQARGHMYDRQGGIKASDRSVGAISTNNTPQIPHIEKSYPVKVTQEDVKGIINTLTPEQKKLADGIQRFLGDQVAAWGNEASMEMYGYEKFNARDYFPIVTDRNFVSTKEEQSQKNSTIKNMGITKSTVKNANNPIIIEDIFDVYTRQVDQMSSYNAYVVPLSDFNKLMNYKDMRGFNGSSIKQEIEKAFGKEGNNYIEKLVEDINGGMRIDRSIGEKLLTNMKAASVAGNLRVAIQQPTAIARASVEISPKYLTRGMITISDKGQWDLICKYAPIAQWKDWGFYRMQTSRQLKDILFGTDNLLQSGINKTMILAELGDKVAWNRLWKACEYETQDLHPDLKEGSEEYYKWVGKRFSDIVDRTQVADSILHRTQIMRSENGFNKLATSFMAEPLKSYNMLYRAKLHLDRKEKGAVSYAGKAASAFVANAFLTSLASAIIDATRDDDRKKDWKEKYWDYVSKNMMDNANPINMIPYAKDVLSIADGFTPVRADLSGMQDIYYAIKKIDKLMKGESEYTTKYIVINTAQAASKFLGIPLKNIIRDATGVIDTVYQAAGGEADYKWLKETYDIGSDENRKRYTKMMLEAKELGNQKLADKIKSDMEKAGIPEDKINDSMNSIINNRIKDEVNIVDVALKYDTNNKESRTAFESEINKYIELKKSAGWDEKKSIQKIREMLTDYYKPLWKDAKTQTEKDSIIKKCKSLYYKGDSIYKDYDFKKNWKDEKDKK